MSDNRWLDEIAPRTVELFEQVSMGVPLTEAFREIPDEYREEVQLTGSALVNRIDAIQKENSAFDPKFYVAGIIGTVLDLAVPERD